MEFPGMTIQELAPNNEEGEDHHLHNHNRLLNHSNQLFFQNNQHQKDLDQFYTQLYNYYYQKGLGVIILNEFCSVISLGFTVFFTSFLMGIVNWSILYECYDEMTCQNVENELFMNPFHHEPSLYSLIISMYFLLFFSYWLFQCHRAVKRVMIAWEMEEFYRVYLKIPFHSISDIDWHEVLVRFIELYKFDQLPFQLFPAARDDRLPSSDNTHSPMQPLLSPDASPDRQHQQQQHQAQKPELDVQHIVWRIMRKENYFIALINKHQLDLYLPWWLTPITTEQLILTKTMEWSLYFCLFDEMFVLTEDGHYIIPASFFDDISGLQGRFQMIGLIMFLLIPFMTIFMIFHFFLENASSFHSTKAYLGPRQWTPFALWQFREFNELKHFFEERMNGAYIPAMEYLLSFRNDYIIVIARLISYVAGGIVATILFVSIFHSEALVHITIFEHNLLWYLGISSALFATSRSILPDETKKNENPANLLQKMTSYTHQENTWRGKEHTTWARNEISELLVFKIQLFLTEISGVLLTPLILCFSLPRCVPTLLDFLRTHSEYRENIGTICDYCTFNVKKHGDPTYGSFTETQEKVPSNGNATAAPNSRQNMTLDEVERKNLENKIRLNDGKLEKSVMNFMQHYPTARLDDQALTFLDKMDTYKSMMKTKRDRELSSIFERSIYPSVGGGRMMLDPHGSGGDRVILPPAHSQSTEEVIPDIGVERGIAMTSPPNLIFPAAVGQDKSFGNSSPVRTLVTSDYYPYEDAATLNNTLANRGMTSGSTLPPLNLPSNHLDRRSGDKLPVIHEQVTSQEFLRSDSKEGGIGAKGSGHGGQAGISILKSPNYSQYHRSRMQQSSRGLTPNRRHPSTSLFGAASRFPKQSVGRGRDFGDEEMPSVLLSLLQKQNIDYENDFYWLEKFHRDKIVLKQDLDKSLLDYQHYQQQQWQHQQQQSHLQSQSQQGSLFPFAMPGGSGSALSRWPPAPPVDPSIPMGMYAENINKNMISSPKLNPAYRKSVNGGNSGNSLKSNSNPQLMGVGNTSSSGDNMANMTSGGGYFPFENSRVNSVDENESQYSPVQEHFADNSTPAKDAQNK